MGTVATTGGSSHSSRDARRRRILDRGSDRLALITGRIQSLPPEPDQSRSSASSTGEIPADPAQHEDAAPNSALPDQESGGEPEQQNIFNETAEPFPQNSGIDVSIASRSVALHDTKDESSKISSSMQSPAQNHQQEQSHRNSVTAGQISSAVAASENMRTCCSVAAAILVILSYIGFPILGFCNIRGIIMLRPLYLLLVTNISVVIGRVMMGTRGTELRMGRKGIGRLAGGNTSIDQLGKVLEVGLMLRTFFTALFMDFSIYVVVLISGLALVRGLG